MTPAPSLTLHASCVAVGQGGSGQSGGWQLGGQAGVLFIGPSGSGKSTLALALMAYGATLVADDRTELAVQGDTLVATCPPAIKGMIEARGLGLLHADMCEAVTIRLVVDLGQTEGQRLPPLRNVTLLGCTLPLVLGQTSPHFPAALWHYVKAGRKE